jgi:hypothetical protein
MGGSLRRVYRMSSAVYRGKNWWKRLRKREQLEEKEKIVKRWLTGIGNFDLKSGFVMLAEPGAGVKRNKRMAAKSM